MRRWMIGTWSAVLVSEVAGAGVTLTNVGLPLGESESVTAVIVGVTDAGLVHGLFSRPQVSSYASFLWSADTGLECIGCHSVNPSYELGAVRADGRMVLVNRVFRQPGFAPQVRGEVRSLTALELFDGEYVTGLSSDGQVLLFANAVRTADGTLSPLTALPGFDPMQGIALSGDGQVVLATTRSASGVSVAALRDASGVWTIVDAPKGHIYSAALAADGGVVVGAMGDAEAGVASAFRWTAERGMEQLPLPEAFSSDGLSAANACSADGRVIGGAVARVDPVDIRACVWIDGEAELLETYLVSRGVDLTGWRLEEAMGVSPSGRFIAGRGYFENATGVSERTVFVLDLQAPPGACRGDTDNSGSVDFDDFVQVIMNWGSTCP